jgi:hypothetical protein
MYMSKMGSHDSFGHLKHKLWSKENSGVKLTFWLPSTKNQESTRFLRVQAACNISLERFQRGLQLFFRPHPNRRFSHEVMGPQSCRNPSCGIPGLPLGSLGTKWHLDVAPVERRREYYKGEGDGFPQVQAVVNLVNPRLHVARLSTKSAQTMH